MNERWQTAWETRLGWTIQHLDVCLDIKVQPGLREVLAETLQCALPVRIMTVEQDFQRWLHFTIVICQPNHNSKTTETLAFVFRPFRACYFLFRSTQGGARFHVACP